jgi:hypothetical protein
LNLDDARRRLARLNRSRRWWLGYCRSIRAHGWDGLLRASQVQGLGVVRHQRRAVLARLAVLGGSA